MKKPNKVTPTEAYKQAINALSLISWEAGNGGNLTLIKELAEKQLKIMQAAMINAGELKRTESESANTN